MEKQITVTVDYTDEFNSGNKNWYNKTARKTSIKCGEVRYFGILTQSQVEHVIALIQDNSSSSIISEIITNYGKENFEYNNQKLLGDEYFLND